MGPPPDRQKFRSFFSLSDRKFSFFIFFGGLLVELWPRFKSMAHQKNGFRFVSFCVKPRRREKEKKSEREWERVKKSEKERKEKKRVTKSEKE